MVTAIQQAQAKLKYYQDKLARERNARRQDKWIEYVNAWRQGVQHVKAGYTIASVSKWATQTASGEISHALAKQEATVRQLQEGGFAKEQIAIFRRTGEMPLRERMRIKDIPPERVIGIRERARQDLERAKATQGIIFLKKQELGKAITESEKRRLTAREKRATRIIKKAEDIMGIKDSGAGFIPGEVAKAIRKGTITDKLLFFSQKTESRTKELSQQQTDLKKKLGRGQALLSPQYKQNAMELGRLALKQIALSIAMLGPYVVNLIKNPANIKDAPGDFVEGLIEEGKATGELFMVSPTAGLIKIGAEFYVIKGTGKAFKITGKVKASTGAKITNKLKGVEITKRTITIPSKQVGKVLDIKIGGPVKKLAEPLKAQLKLAGKKVIGVSAQADRIVNLLKTKRVVRKPFPNEAKLSIRTKRLLKKFDEGKITKRELILLDRRIIKETRRAGSLLERSFFADPRGRLRPSRLGITRREASLLDVFTGKATFKTQKPQVLVFEDIKIQKFPKTKIFKTIKSKLKTGKSLSQKEANALLQFQLKKSGKFKPIGHLTREPEITLSPGEIIKKGKTIAKAKFNGKYVPIIRATVVKAKPTTKKLLKRAEQGKITTKELKTLRNNLRKETGFKQTSLSRGKVSKLKYPLARRGTALSLSLTKRRLPKRPAKRPPVRPPRKPPKEPPRKPPKRPPRKPPKEPPRKPPVRPPVRPPRRPPKKPPRVPPRPPARPPVPIKVIPRVAKKRKIPKKKPVRPRSFEVWARPLKKKGQKKPKLIKVSKVPLSKKRAKDLRNYITDTSLGRTARIKPSIGKPTTPKLKTPVGYSRKTSAKFRRYKIKKGKRIPLIKGRIIEKRRHLLDTTQEKKQITLRRRIAQLSRPPKKRPSPKRKPTKRKKPIRRDRGIFG